MKIDRITFVIGMLLVLASTLFISCSPALEDVSKAPTQEKTVVQNTIEPLPVFDTSGLTVETVISRIVDPDKIGMQFASYDPPPETIAGLGHRNWLPPRGSDPLAIDGMKGKYVGGTNIAGLFRYDVGEFESNGNLYASLFRYREYDAYTSDWDETRSEFFERGIVVLGAMGFPLENARSALDRLKSELDTNQLKSKVQVCEGGFIVIINAMSSEGSSVGYYLQVFPQPCDSATKSIRTNTIATWTGKSIKNTELFHISTNQWKISWETWPGEFGAMNFQIYIYEADGTPHAPFVAANVIGEDTDSSIVRGIGDYYFTFNTGQPYKVVVEEIQ
jgi:hypothetical protein